MVGKFEFGYCRGEIRRIMITDGESHNSPESPKVEHNL